MKTKTKIGLMYGGRSGEHEVSCWSAEFVRNNLDERKYRILDIKIEKDGRFDLELIRKADVIFPVTHGTFGEDGCLQGMLEMLDKPYVGAEVLGSAVGMDKEVQKRLLREAGVPVARYISLSSSLSLKNYEIPFRFPVFVKPVNGGSSVGVSKCKSKSKLRKAIEQAFLYDTRVLIEEAMEGREIEVAVLGDELAGFPVAATLPGEVTLKGKHEFYDYEAKYVDENGAKLRIPVESMSKSKITEIQKLAIKTFKVLGCSGMARVDMFLQPNGRLVVNEINTLPGFTDRSMYPRLMEISGISKTELITRLIEMAQKRRQIKQRLVRGCKIKSKHGS